MDFQQASGRDVPGGRSFRGANEGDDETSRDFILNSELFLRSEGLEAIGDVLKQEEPSNIWVSSSFAAAMQEKAAGEELLRFYGVRRRKGPLYSWDPSPVIELLKSGAVRTYDGTQDLESNEEPELLLALRRETDSHVVAATLFDEWRFMQTHSWWVGGPRARNGLEALLNAGVGLMEVGRGFLDKASRRVLKLPEHEFPEPLRKSQQLRAAIKFVGAAGPGIAGIVAPPFATLLGVTVPVAFLFDP